MCSTNLFIHIVKNIKYAGWGLFFFDQNQIKEEGRSEFEFMVNCKKGED